MSWPESGLMRLMRATIPVLLLVSVWSQSLFGEQVYRWLDERGRVHFGDTPPQQQDAQRLDTKTPESPGEGDIPFDIAPPPYSSPNTLELRDALRALPPPSWWNSVEAPVMHFENYKEFLRYWQSEKRCCKREEIELSNRVFFKVAWQAILEHTHDDDLVAVAFKLMNLSYLDYPQQLQLQELGLSYFFHHDKPLDWCANCRPGDNAARMIYSMRYLYRQRDKDRVFIALSRKFLAERGEVTSVWAQLELYDQLAQAYWDAEAWPKAIETLNLALARFEQPVLPQAVKSRIERIKRTRQRFLGQN